MAWLLLAAAGILEAVWAYYMKLSEGFSRPCPIAVTLITMIASFALLSWAMKSLPLGSAYVIWTGIGAVGTFVIGIIVLGEEAGFLRIFAALLILSGLVLMKVASPQ
ncbi:MAG TPA: multidrug efflux SMR transporter [Candidatus Hydrogenedentes bacterium]|nr:multidrug efflux SMR transporter [Candidatus Hydrogenedentota bacterium]